MQGDFVATILALLLLACENSSTNATHRCSIPTNIHSGAESLDLSTLVGHMSAMGDDVSAPIQQQDEEDNEGIDPNDELFATKPIKPRRMYAYDW